MVFYCGCLEEANGGRVRSKKKPHTMGRVAAAFQEASDA
jgi:hypothetical protein